MRGMARVMAWAAFFSVYLWTAAAAAEIPWFPLDITSALSAAQAEGKLIYVFVEGDNCPPCDAFKASHLPDPAFVDFINTLFIPIRAHESDPAGRAFLESLRLVHGAVPRFYVLGPDGAGLSMSIGMVTAPPMGGADMMRMTFGRRVPVNQEQAAAVAARIRAHAASQREANLAGNPMRDLGLAVLEAQAWMMAGRTEEAEQAFGLRWAERLPDQEMQAWYANFWLSWGSNLSGALTAARLLRSANPDDPQGAWLLAMALAANGHYDMAVQEAEVVLHYNPDNADIRRQVDAWRERIR